MLGLVESSGSETFPVRRPTRLGGSFPPDGRVSVNSCDDVGDDDLDDDLGLGASYPSFS